MSTPHKCPVCDGNGRRIIPVPISGTVQHEEICPACKGSGIVWEVDYKVDSPWTVPPPKPTTTSQ